MVGHLREGCNQERVVAPYFGEPFELNMARWLRNKADARGLALTDDVSSRIAGRPFHFVLEFTLVEGV
jgi:hypothetical protein